MLEESVDESQVEPHVAMAVLRALALMARSSKRHQAELGVALHRAGLTVSPEMQGLVVRHLESVASIENVITLDDGAVLVSVTAAGVERASR